jgi:hypothetical protein
MDDMHIETVVSGMVTSLERLSSEAFGKLGAPCNRCYNTPLVCHSCKIVKEQCIGILGIYKNLCDAYKPKTAKEKADANAANAVKEEVAALGALASVSSLASKAVLVAKHYLALTNPNASTLLKMYKPKTTSCEMYKPKATSLEINKFDDMTGIWTCNRTNYRINCSINEIIEKTYNRNYDRIYDRNYDRIYDRNYAKIYDRIYDRTYDRTYSLEEIHEELAAHRIVESRTKSRRRRERRRQFAAMIAGGFRQQY